MFGFHHSSGNILLPMYNDRYGEMPDLGTQMQGLSYLVSMLMFLCSDQMSAGCKDHRWSYTLEHVTGGQWKGPVLLPLLGIYRQSNLAGHLFNFNHTRRLDGMDLLSRMIIQYKLIFAHGCGRELIMDSGLKV